MIIKSIKISGNKQIGNTVEITLNSKYNHIDCDDVSLKVVSNALGSFFHPETALKQQIWNRNDFEAGGYIQILALNKPKMLMGFRDTSTLTLTRKVNQTKIMITDDRNTTHQLTIQQFLNCLCSSGICVPTVFKVNVENIVSWINGEMIQNWTNLSFAELWNRIYNDVLCNDRYDILQDWMIRTRRAEQHDNQCCAMRRDQVEQKIQNHREIIESAEEFSLLYKKAETLRAIIAGNDVTRNVEAIDRLEHQKDQLQMEIFKLEKDVIVTTLLEAKNDQLLESMDQLELLSLGFECEYNYFGNVEELPDDINYKSFLQNLTSHIKSYRDHMLDYQNIREKCMKADVDLRNYHFLYENEQSKITAMNLYPDDRTDLETFIRSFESPLPSFEVALATYEEKVLQSNEQLATFLKENDIDELIQKLQTIESDLLTNARQGIRDTTNHIRTCLMDLRDLKSERIMFEETLQESISFICASSDIDVSYVKGLVAFEALLDVLNAEKSWLLDQFVCLLVREFTWKDITDHPFTLECIWGFLIVVVADREAAQGFLERLPDTNIIIISLHEFNTGFKEDLPIIRHAQHRDILTVHQLISPSSMKNLVKEVYRKVLLVSKSSQEENLDAKNVKRTLYYDDNEFNVNEGVCGGGHVLTVATEFQEHLIRYLDSAKVLRTVKEKIVAKEQILINLKEKLQNQIYDTCIPVNWNGKQFMEHFELMERDFTCLREKNIQEIKVETARQLNVWFTNNPDPLSITSIEDAYLRQSELKEQILSLELEYDKMMDEKVKGESKIMKVIIEILKLEEDLMVKFDFGRYQLVDIDKDFNEEIRNGLKNINESIDECCLLLQNTLIQVKELRAKNLRKLSSKETTIVEETLLRKRLILIQVVSKIASILNHEPPKTRSSATNRYKRDLLQEFPTRDAQITELSNLQHELKRFEGFTSPEQINMKIISLKTGLHKYEEQLITAQYWPTGFLENVFIMQNKASCHAISCIFDYARTLSSMILPKDVLLNLWLVIDRQNGSSAEALDLMSVREINYAIIDNTESNKIYLSKELIIILIIQGICCTFQVPFIVMDDIFRMFDKRFWNMISRVLKVLAEKRQIIVIKGITKEEAWTDDGQPDKVVTVRTSTARTTMQKSGGNNDMSLGESQLYVELQRSLQSMWLTDDSSAEP